MRVQGGTMGLLSAFEAGRLDPLDGRDPPKRAASRWMNGADWRLYDRRTRRKLKKLAKRLDEQVAKNVPF